MTDREPQVGDYVLVGEKLARVSYVSTLGYGADVEDLERNYLRSYDVSNYGKIVYTTPPESDNVNHPVHYTSHPSGVECITIVRHYNFNVGGAIKYLWRNGLKDEDAQVEDLKKAIWLIENEIDRLQGATDAV